MMSSVSPQILGFTIANALHLLGIIVVALILARLLRGATNSLIHSNSLQSRTAQQREQQTRAAANSIYTVGSRVIWAMALLTALPEFGISVLPGITLAGLGLLVVALGTRDLVRDMASGFCIVLENQYASGDTIQAGNITGRVEQFDLRRTVLRDARGALVTIPNRKIQNAANLSRDWSQVFVDVPVAAETQLEKALQALEAASADLRGDVAWGQALVDGPRILGVQAFDQQASTVRLQVRTAPTRQDEVSRELRRRIQIEFQRRGISPSNSAISPVAAAETRLT